MRNELNSMIQKIEDPEYKKVSSWLYPELDALVEVVETDDT